VEGDMKGRIEDYIIQRAIDSAIYTIENNSTVRQTADYIGVSKSTVHKDLKERLPRINPSLYEKVSNVLEKNGNERYIRGGMATRKVFERLRKLE